MKFLLALLCASTLSFSGCKDPNELGLQTLPLEDQLTTIACDTSTILSRTIREDSIRSDEVSLQLLGTMNDPVFGKHSADIYTQTILQGVPNFGTVTQADSMILILAYKGYYGDTMGRQSLTVFQLTEDIHIDSGYYTNRTFGSDLVSIGSLTYYPRPNTSVVLDSDTVAAQIRIRMSQSLANHIMQLNGQSQLSSNDNWRAYFKGLFIQAGSTVYGTGCISYFDFFNSNMTLYYHDTAGNKLNYTFSLIGARVNSFSHDYTGCEAGRQLVDSNAVDSLNFLQSMGSLKTRIYFPFLKHFSDSGSIVLNKAELEIHMKQGLNLGLAPPSQLLLLVIDSTGTSSVPLDYYESAGYYGGSLASDGITYKFNIARQLQGILDGRLKNYGFSLVIAGSSVQANQLVIGSGKNSSYPLKLNLYYTKLH